MQKSIVVMCECGEYTNVFASSESKECKPLVTKSYNFNCSKCNSYFGITAWYRKEKKNDPVRKVPA